MLKYFLAAMLVFLSDVSVAGGAKAPAAYSDAGACPFECCTYRDWNVEKTTYLLQGASSGSKKIRLLPMGAQVNGLTGTVEVTRPGRLLVLKTFVSEISGTRYQKGDVVYVYTPLGEGFFKVWHGGKMYDEEATFMYHDMGGFDRCVDEGTCWGKRLAFPEYTWWVKVKTPKGVVGWSDQPENFGNQDACG